MLLESSFPMNQRAAQTPTVSETAGSTETAQFCYTRHIPNPILLQYLQTTVEMTQVSYLYFQHICYSPYL